MLWEYRLKLMVGVLQVMAFFCISGISNSLFAADWPCYRGPNKDGSTTETIESWPPREVWTASIGQGFSQVVVFQGQVYTMGWSNGQDRVYCFSASSTGVNPVVLWQASYPAGVEIGPSSDYGTCATPTVDGNNVYTFSTAGLLNCFDAATGHTNWSVNVGTASEPGYGFCGSPLVEGSNVIVDAGGNGMAFNKYSGVLQWTSFGGAGYGSPYTITVGTQRTVVVNSYSECVGVDPVSGTVLWNYPKQYIVDDSGSIDPIIYSNQLWIAQSWGPALLVNLGSGTLTNVVWQMNSMCGDNCSVFYNGYIYGSSYQSYDPITYQYDLGGGIQCVDFATGVAQWNANVTEFGSFSSVIRAGNQLVMMAGTQAGDPVGCTNGDLVVANATPTGYQEVYRTNGILPGYTWTCPTLSDGRLYVRNNTTVFNTPATLICYDVSTSSGGSESTNNVPPSVWMQQYFPGTATNDYANLAGSIASNGMTVWQCYLAGLSPTNPTNALKAEIAISNGNVLVTYSTVTAYTNMVRYYEPDSLTNLLNGTWQPVPDATNVLGNNNAVTYTPGSPNSRIYYRIKATLLQ